MAYSMVGFVHDLAAATGTAAIFGAFIVVGLQVHIFVYRRSWALRAKLVRDPSPLLEAWHAWLERRQYIVTVARVQNIIGVLTAVQLVVAVPSALIDKLG
jgi:hypothetical protein